MLNCCPTLPFHMVVLIGVNADRFLCVSNQNNCVSVCVCVFVVVGDFKGHMLNDHSLLSLLGHRR